MCADSENFGPTSVHSSAKRAADCSASCQSPQLLCQHRFVVGLFKHPVVVVPPACCQCHFSLALTRYSPYTHTVPSEVILRNMCYTNLSPSTRKYVCRSHTSDCVTCDRASTRAPWRLPGRQALAMVGLYYHYYSNRGSMDCVTSAKNSSGCCPARELCTLVYAMERPNCLASIRCLFDARLSRGVL